VVVVVLVDVVLVDVVVLVVVDVLVVLVDVVGGRVVVLVDVDVDVAAADGMAEAPDSAGSRPSTSDVSSGAPDCTAALHALANRSTASPNARRSNIPSDGSAATAKSDVTGRVSPLCHTGDRVVATTFWLMTGPSISGVRPITWRRSASDLTGDPTS
jgi:hypothetical protein